MKRRIRYLLNEAVAMLLLAALVACNVNYRPSFKESITDAGLRSRVSRVIDTQMENIKEYLDEDLRTHAEGERGTRLSGFLLRRGPFKRLGGS